MMVVLPSHHSAQAENNAFEIGFSSIRDEYAVSLQDGSFLVHNETGLLSLPDFSARLTLANRGSKNSNGFDRPQNICSVSRAIPSLAFLRNSR